jgi:hypothetical protein
MLKTCFNKLSKIDDSASMLDYIYRMPIKLAGIKTHRELAFTYLAENGAVNVDNFTNAPVSIMQDIKLQDTATTKHVYSYRFSLLGPNPNGAKLVKKK